MKRFFLELALFIGLFGCQSFDSIHPRAQNKFELISLDISPNQSIIQLQKVNFEFSSSLNLSSINDHSIKILAEDHSLINELLDQKDSDGEGYEILGSIDVLEDKKLVWSNSPNHQEIIPGKYYLFISSSILSQDQIPLKSPTKEGYFIPFFILASILDENTDPVNQEIALEESEELNNDLPINETLDSVDSDEERLIVDPMIYEIFYDPSEEEKDGHIFIEIYASSPINLSGYLVNFINGSNGEVTDQILFNENHHIPEDGFFVVADAIIGQNDQTNVLNYDYIVNFDPQNGPDTVALLNPYGEIVDLVGYGEFEVDQINDIKFFESNSALDVRSGFSLSRKNFIDSDNNLEDFFENQLPSPGTKEIVLAENTNRENEASDHQVEPIDKQVLITEVVVDPIHDWNDTEGGNGILFDNIPGSGTVGYSDEWIEIYNNSEEIINLVNWKIEMIDGTDELEIFGETDAEIIFSDDSDLENFNPESYMVMGNPKGSMKNDITIIVYNHNDQLVDQVTIKNGQSNTAEDESFSLDENFFWIRKISNPLR